jgi:hypothetical protein
MSRPKVRPGAVSLAVATAALLLAQLVMGRACRDALFLSSFAPALLPRAMLAASLLGLVTVLGISRLLGRFGPGRVVPAFLLVSGSIFAVEWELLGRAPALTVVLVYLHTSIAGGIAVSGLWSVVNERFDPHSVSTIAPKLAAGLAAGGLFGGLAARGVGGHYGLRTLLVVLAASSVSASFAVRRLARGSAALERTPEEPVKALDGTTARYLGTIALFVLLAGLSSAVVDFAFKSNVSRELGTGSSLVGFFAVFYMLVSVVSIVLQFTLARFVLARFGLGVGLASVPAAVVGLGLTAIAVPGAWLSVLLRGSCLALESSLYRAAYEPLYAPLPVAQKRAKKALIDVAADRAGEALGSGAILFFGALVPGFVPSAGLGLGVLAAGTAVLLALRLERGYVAELAASLKGGRVRLDDGDVLDPTTRLTLSQTQSKLDRSALVREIAALEPDRAPPTPEPAPSELLSALAAGEPARINRALLAAPLDPAHASLVIACLERADVAEAAVVALRPLAPSIPGQLVDALLDRARPLRLRKRVPRVLRSAAHPRAVRGLAEALSDDEPEIRQRSALALRELGRRRPELRPPRRLVLDAAKRELSVGVHAGALERVFTLLALVCDAEPIELSLRALGSSDDKLRGTALEYLEHVVPEPIRSGIWPYLQPAGRVRQSRSRRPSDIAHELRRSLS